MISIFVADENASKALVVQVQMLETLMDKYKVGDCVDDWL